MNIGAKFEEELSKEFEIKKTPGSGNQWYSKLDLFGRGARWSLKATAKKSISIGQDVIDEAVNACERMSGDGSMPLWAFRIGDDKHDIIAMRKEDFKLLQAGELKLIGEGVKEQVAQRRAKASTPVLFRDES